MKNVSTFTAFMKREIPSPPVVQRFHSILTREIPLPRFLRREGRLERILILLHALIALIVGYGLLVSPEAALHVLHFGSFNSKPFPDIGMRLAGALLGGLAMTLLCLLPMTAPEVRRRIAVGLFVNSGFLFFANLFVLMRTGSSVTALIVVAVLFGTASLLAVRLRVYAGWTGFDAETRDLQRKWQDQIREAAAQQERNRLARDLHDSIKQQIFSVRVASATVEARLDSDPAGAREALAHVRKSAQEAAVEMQALLHQLRPEALANVGLVEALREQCEALGYRTGAEVTVEIGELPPDTDLPPAAQEALFRVAQEALSNVARHARAKRVHVRLRRDDEEGKALVLEIRDDGQGFDPTPDGPGMGLRNMKDRLQPFRGSLEIESAAGAGTRLTARLPRVPAASTKPPRAAETSEEVAIRRIKGEALFFSFAMIALQLAGEAATSLLGFLLLVLLYSATVTVRTLLARRQPVATGTVVARVFLMCSAFWTLPGAWYAGFPERLRFLSHPAALLAVGALILALILTEIRNHSRRLRGTGPGRRRDLPLVALLLGFAVSLPFFFLVDPVTVGRACVIAAGLFYVAWWVWDSLQAEER